MKTIDIETLTKLMIKLDIFLKKHIAQQCFELISDAINDKSEDIDWDNTRICMVDGNMSFHVISGTPKNTLIVYTEDDIAEIVKSDWKKHLDESVSVKVINKRVLGRLIIKYIGNEGADVDDRKAGLRKLFQATIDYIQTHMVTHIWENATVTVYDLTDNAFKISSGNGINHFLVTENKGKPTVTYTVNNQPKELNTSDEQSNWKWFQNKCYNFTFFGRCYPRQKAISSP